MKKIITVISLLMILVLTVTSCGNDNVITDNETDTQTQEDTVTTTSVIETEEEKVDTVYYINPLTGTMDSEKDLTMMRPVAVVLKNDKNGAPQFGISDADVVYEAVVEGGTTRLLALYSDYSSVEKIGPVIDSRAPFHRIATTNDAVLVQAGATAYTKTVQKNLNIDCVDAILGEMSPLFERNEELIESRGYSSSILANGPYFSDKMRSGGISSKREDGSEALFNFNTGKPISDNSDYCTKLTVPYSSIVSPYFEYSTLTNTYSRYQFGDAHTDADGTVLKYKNILVLLSKYSITDSTTGEMDIDLLSGGEGFYVSEGKYIPINWNVDSSSGVLVYTDENGETVKLSQGKTFVCITSAKYKSKITFN